MAATEIALDELVEYVADDASGASGPKYVRLFEAFSDCVISGRFKPGERVPTETELARNLPYSVGTVQKALAQLVSNGLIVRHRRTGTFIAERRSQANKVFVYRFRDPATGKMMLPFVRTLAVTVDESDGPWRRALNVKRMVRVDRLGNGLGYQGLSVSGYADPVSAVSVTAGAPANRDNGKLWSLKECCHNRALPDGNDENKNAFQQRRAS